jgi:hypothetical protein
MANEPWNVNAFTTAISLLIDIVWNTRAVTNEDGTMGID